MIRLLVLDVDGTMTDGGVYYDATGNELKKFAIKDGAGLVLARTAGIRVMICTGRECEAVRRRAADLKITDIYQNVGKKAAFLRDFMAENGYARDDVAYCGDDLNDLAAMALCGFVACPADAAPEVRVRADYICPQRGGEGAVRGAVEKILRGDGRWNDAVKKAFQVDASIRPYGLTEGDFMKNKKHTPLLAALATLVVLLAGVVLIWLAKVRPDVGKGRSEIVTDFLRAELLQDGQTATQVFTYDKDILTIGLEFYLPGDQPCGALDVVLYDADTGEELSRSVGTMDYIVPDHGDGPRRDRAGGPPLQAGRHAALRDGRDFGYRPQRRCRALEGADGRG